MKRKSIIKKYMILSLLSGVAMGSVFPFFTLLFVKFKNTKIFILFLMSCVGAGVMVGLISFVIGKTTLISAVKKLQIAFGEVGRGNLNVTCEIDSKDELGEAADGFNSLVSNFSEAVHDINESAGSITESIESVKSELDRLLAKEENATKNQGQFLNGHKNSECTINSMEIGTENISIMSKEQVINLKTCSNHLEMVQIESGNIKNKSDESTDNMEGLIKSINVEKRNLFESKDIFNSIYDNSIEISEIAVKTEKNSNDITDILNSTVNLLKQTNTLALNAKIESSRESVSGKGFAVVAEEMIKLAGTTNELVNGIQDMTDNILEDIGMLSKLTQRNTIKVDEFKSINSNSNKNLDGILTGVISSAEDVKEIDKCIEKQLEYVKNMQSNWIVIKENSENINKQSALNKETTYVIKEELLEIQNMAEAFNSIADSLKKRVDFFEL